MMQPRQNAQYIEFQDFEKIVRGLSNRIHVLETQEHSHLIVNANLVPLQGFWVPYGAGYSPVTWSLHTTGRVFIEGLVARSSGSHVTGEWVALMPVGARPRMSLVFNQRVSGGMWRIDVNANGTVIIVDDGGVGVPETYVSLSGINYLAAL
jgi:hypothetical protein